jgi:hypothetical protein
LLLIADVAGHRGRARGARPIGSQAGWEVAVARKRFAIGRDRPQTARDRQNWRVLMRYLVAALALAFAVGTMSAAQACPNKMKTAQVASAGGQTAPPSTKVRIPTPPEG